MLHINVKIILRLLQPVYSVNEGTPFIQSVACYRSVARKMVEENGQNGQKTSVVEFQQRLNGFELVETL